MSSSISVSSSSIFNGAECGTYCWSQSHTDLEIRVKLIANINIKYEDVVVELVGQKINVAVRDHWANENQLYNRSEVCNFITLLDGQLQRPIDRDTLFWLLDCEDHAIVIYIDKAENLWWSKLLNDEEPTEVGPKNYTIMIDHVDHSSRMVIDRLIVDQRNKMIQKRDRDELDHHY